MLRKAKHQSREQTLRLGLISGPPPRPPAKTLRHAYCEGCWLCACGVLIVHDAHVLQAVAGPQAQH
jgi:hypothetical protein